METKEQQGQLNSPTNSFPIRGRKGRDEGGGGQGEGKESYFQS